jgi:opacity protein-like surface antigen
MKNSYRAFLFCFCLTSASVFAGGPTVETPTSKDAPMEETHGFPFEADFEYGYVGQGEVSRGRLPNLRDVRDFDEDYIYARFIYTPRIAFGILRLGAAYERFGFGAPNLFEVPGGLQSASAVVGLDTKFSDAILIRFEATPGFYSSKHLDGDDFHAPMILGGTYIYSSDLQFVLGVSFDYEREQPVLPGGGIRWRLASQWLLDAVLPTPRLNYELTRNFTLYGGADIKGSTFRVDDNFGTQRGDARLNHAVVTYTEVRAGVGFEWKLAPEIKMSLEGGYLPYRNVDFYRADVRYHHEEGAPYGSLAIHAAF